jgi:hypothetical protein
LASDAPVPSLTRAERPHSSGAAASQRIGAAQQNRATSNPFRTLSEYEIRNLAEHLAAAHQDESLDRLLRLEYDADGARKNARFEITESLGEIVGYLSDVAVFRVRARDNAAEESTRAGVSPSIGREIRSRLLASSVTRVTAAIASC